MFKCYVVEVIAVYCEFTFKQIFNFMLSSKTSFLSLNSLCSHIHVGYFPKLFKSKLHCCFQASKQLVALTDLKNHDKHLEDFREAMGVMQHHDAVTGTEKQFVADDYARILYKSIYYAEDILSEAIE